MKLKKVAVTSALIIACAITATVFINEHAKAAGTNRYVANGGSDVANDCSSQVTPCATIQHAVDESVSGDTINVAAGTYAEQVRISTSNLAITGDGAGSTIVEPSAVVPNTTSLFSGADVSAIFVVENATGVTIEELTIDGGTAGASIGCAPTFIGIFYRAASGVISGTHVTNIWNPAVSGCQNFLGIFVQSGNGGPNLNSNVVITDNIVDNYGKNGITANEAGTSVTVTGNTITGEGLTWLAAQNGVQLAYGGHGKVTNNTISDNYYSSPQWVACGVLSIYGGGAIGQTKTNTFSGNSVNVCTAGYGPSSNSPFNP